MIRTECIGHVHFLVADVERAARFYREAFGASETFRLGDDLVFMALPGGAVVALDARPEAVRNPAHVGFRLSAGEELDAAVDEVHPAGGRVLERGEHAPGIAYAYITDPDGNVIEL